MNKITIKKTNMIKEEDITPKGANSPTYKYIYECLCKEGEITEEVTPGFNDSFVTLNCKNCLKKYHSFIDYLGNMWSLYEKEKQ